MTALPEAPTPSGECLHRLLDNASTPEDTENETTDNQRTSRAPGDPSAWELLRTTLTVLVWIVVLPSGVGGVLAIATWVTGVAWLMWLWLPIVAVVVLLLFVLVESGALPGPAMPRRMRRYDEAAS